MCSGNSELKDKRLKFKKDNDLFKKSISLLHSGGYSKHYGVLAECHLCLRNSCSEVSMEKHLTQKENCKNDHRFEGAHVGE